MRKNRNPLYIPNQHTYEGMLCENKATITELSKEKECQYKLSKIKK